MNCCIAMIATHHLQSEKQANEPILRSLGNEGQFNVDCLELLSHQSVDEAHIIFTSHQRSRTILIWFDRTIAMFPYWNEFSTVYTHFFHHRFECDNIFSLNEIGITADISIDSVMKI